LADPAVLLESFQTGVRSSFTVTITPSSTTLSSVLKNEMFQVDLGWLASVQTNEFNCLMYAADGTTLDYNFDRIQRTGFRMMNVMAANDIPISKNTSWKLKCNGGTVAPNPILKMAPSVSWYESTLTNAIQTSPTNTAAPPTFTAKNALTVTLSKKSLSTPYAPAEYEFAITLPSDVNLSTSISYLVVEFYRTIPPGLNTQNPITCYINEFQSDCQVVADYRVQIKFPIITPSVTLRILGIMQPSPIYMPSVTSSIWVSLVPDGDYLGTHYFTALQEIPPTYPLGTFPIHSVSLTSQGIRASADHTLVFTPPLASIIFNQPFVVQFWYTLQPQVFDPTCSLTRSGDDSKYDWAFYCVWSGYTTLLIYPSGTDGNITSTQAQYTLTIKKGPSVD
jgi:hypothetical protein